jgi:hypothetical protein
LLSGIGSSDDENAGDFDAFFRTFDIACTFSGTIISFNEYTARAAEDDVDAGFWSV